MGFSIIKEYPGRFLRGEDVAGHTLELKIKTVKKEKIYKIKEKKEVPTLIVYFEGKDRGVVLGKERATDLKEMFGDNTDDWIGKTVTMYAQERDIFGKNVNVIRFKNDGEKALSKELDSLSV